MNRHLWTRSAFVAMALAGLVSSARADATLAATYKNTPENTAHILSIASATLDVGGLTNLLRLEGQSKPAADSPFSVDYLSDSTARISWDLTGTGMTLDAIYVFGGSNGANLYQITDASQMISGSTVIHTPLTGNSGQFAGISHTLFLGAIPEPSSVVLLAVAGVGLAGATLRKRRS